jgi:hypothetical protein
MKTLITASIAAAVAFASPAVATAESKEWDIGAYDQCYNSGLGKGFTQEEFEAHVKYCCLKTGGVWAGHKCVAPPKEEASSTRWVGEVPVHVFEPMRPATRTVDGVEVHPLTEAP